MRFGDPCIEGGKDAAVCLGKLDEVPVGGLGGRFDPDWQIGDFLIVR